MRDPFEIDGSCISASLSMGIAIAPDDASERADLMQVANLALFRAKREGRNRAAFYQPVMEQTWRRLKSIETELRDAITHEGLVLRYQPIVSTLTGRTVCVEALVRWQHPIEGLIAPDRFIGLAEDRGLILPLGEWVLRQACNDARDWPGLRVAVNVSPIQFRHPAFVATVGQILAETGLEPARLELELTEGVLVENEEEAYVAIAELRDRGVRMALDDFGTGYSSLIYLRRFSFDKIKIDRAFIEALEPTGESAILVDSVVRLGRALGLTVTAEGIETQEQRDFLSDLACDELQGYLMSRPLAKGDLGLFLQAESRASLSREAPIRERVVA
jgi:EAL domain-containing protein (putative c-di-GMP-specific phosphodiesterase class I)